MKFDEKKYLFKTLVQSNISSVVLLAVIMAVGIYALTSSQPIEKNDYGSIFPSQINRIAQLFGSLIERDVQINFEKANYALESYTKNTSGFKLVPDIPFDEQDFDKIPNLFFNNYNLTRQDAYQINSMVRNLKSIIGADFLLYQRLNAQGDMLLINHTFYDLPNNLKINLISSENNFHSKSLIEKIFKGQTYTILKNINGNIYSITFRRIIDKKGKIIGMIGIMNKLSGRLDFNLSFNGYNIAFYDALTRSLIYSQDSIKRKSTQNWADSLLKTAISSFELQDLSYGRTAYFNNNLNLLIVAEMQLHKPPMPSGLRANGIKMLLAATIIVIIIIIFFSVRNYDKFSSKINEKEKFLVEMLGILCNGKHREFENHIAEKLYKGEIEQNEVINLLRRVNQKMLDLEQDKLDLQDILDAKIAKIITLSEKINKIKTEGEEKINEAIDQFTDLTVKITQLATTAAEISRWETPTEITNKFDNNSPCEKLREKSKILKTKSGILADKIEKIFTELSLLKKVAESIHFIAINSSIFAEKGNIEKLELLAAEIRKISENLINSQDQLYYLTTEARNALYACSYDLETIEIVLDNTPKQSDIAKMLLEYSKFNERIALISDKFNHLTEELKNTIKNLENSKIKITRLDGIVNELLNISEQI